MRREIKQAINFVLDTLLPIKCIYCCKVFDVYLCDGCYKKIKFIKHQVCPICRNKSNFGKVCTGCKSKSYIDSLFVLCEYDDLISRILQEYKYNNILGVESVIQRIMQMAVLSLHQLVDEKAKISYPSHKNGLTQDNDSIFSKMHLAECEKYTTKYIKNLMKDTLLIPIPLHKKRLVERGFNQSEKICKILSSIINIPVDNFILQRIKYTSKQSLLNKEQRESNILNSFKINKKTSFSGRLVILVDDVYTTGSTMQECARMLKSAGNADEVHGFVLARGKY